jgi:hypothetical protein
MALIAVLSLIQASSPIPRSATESSVRSAHKIQDQSENQQEPANSPAPVNSQVQPSPAKPNIENQSSKDSDQYVKVVEFPAVSGNRDKIDWALWIFNFALVVVGFLQWSVLKKQAKIAHNQELQMIAAGKQTEQVIAQMKETEVRDLRAYVGAAKVILNLQNSDVPRGIVEIQNFGKTPAYEVRQWMGITIHSHPLTIVLPESSNPETASRSALFPNVKNVSLVDLKKPLPSSTVIGKPQLTVGSA